MEPMTRLLRFHIVTFRWQGPAGLRRRLRAGEKLLLRLTPCNLNKVVSEIVDEMTVVHGKRFFLNSQEAVEGNWNEDGVVQHVSCEVVAYVK